MEVVDQLTPVKPLKLKVYIKPRGCRVMQRKRTLKNYTWNHHIHFYPTIGLVAHLIQWPVSQ